MSFWNSLANCVEREVERKFENIKREVRRNLRKKSDQQIRNAYCNRYSGNIQDWQIELIEEEARRRGIS